MKAFFWTTGCLLAFLVPDRIPAATAPMAAVGLSGKPLRGYRICVDPGHGGQSARDGRYTGGTFGAATRQTESDVNLRVSLMLAQFLEEAGATVILTRTTDNRVQDKPDMSSELDARSRYANSRRADLFISMHHNDGPRGVNYTAVFYHRNSPQSNRLADQISASLAFCLGTPNIGARSSAYRVLKDLRMPGVIVECSFMTNSSEDARLANLSYNKLQAKGVAVGIINYVRQTKGRGVDFTSVFGPLDELGNRTQVVADSTYRGDGPPPSAPFFGRKNQAPGDETAFATATASAAMPVPTDAEASASNAALQAMPGDSDLSPLPTGAPSRIEAIRQSAASTPVRSRSSTSTNASRPASGSPPRSTSSARSSTASRSSSGSSSSRQVASTNSTARNRATPGTVVARSSGASSTPSSRSSTASSRSNQSSARNSSSTASTRRSGSSTPSASSRSGSSSGSSRTGSSSSSSRTPSSGRASVSYSRSR